VFFDLNGTFIYVSNDTCKRLTNVHRFSQGYLLSESLFGLITVNAKGKSTIHICSRTQTDLDSLIAAVPQAFPGENQVKDILLYRNEPGEIQLIVTYANYFVERVYIYFAAKGTIEIERSFIYSYSDMMRYSVKEMSQYPVKALL
jgi:hypothetical protein